MFDGQRRGRTGGAIALAALCATLATLPGTSIAASERSPAGATSSTARCSASALSLTLISETGASGKRFDTLALRNRGHICHLLGYPGVGLLSRAGHLIRLNVGRRSRTEEAVNQVVLGSGQRAYFIFLYEDGGFCPGHSVPAYGLQVYPPGSTLLLRLRRARFDVCTTFPPVVGPVRRTSP